MWRKKEGEWWQEFSGEKRPVLALSAPRSVGTSGARVDASRSSPCRNVATNFMVIGIARPHAILSISVGIRSHVLNSVEQQAKSCR